MRFVDTNVLLYRVSSDPAEVEKAERSESILKEEDLCLSVQVLQEFYVQATWITKPGAISHEHAVGLIHGFKRYPVSDLTIAVVEAALISRHRWSISYWDAAIVESARAMGCPIVLSEDLSHEIDYDGVRVVNPFA